MIEFDYENFKVANCTSEKTKFIESVNHMAELAHADSVRHGLMQKYDKVNDISERRKLLCARIVEELVEAYGAVDDDFHFAEELADVGIMLMVTAHNEHIKLGTEIVRKAQMNYRRPYMHGKLED